jgi:RNA polymerase subunit RPABC4/transcription elongation factor Spt4
MDTRIFHGDIAPDDVARALLAQFNRGNLRAQQLGSGNKVVVQIATLQRPASGGQTALTVNLERVEDGLSIQLGKQAWLGVAASLGMTALAAWKNPWNLLSRLDDLAQDIENLQLSEQIWGVIEGVARASGASFELSERLRRLVCEYCQTANPVGEASCIACGAPLGNAQPRTCSNCGFVVKTTESLCPNCGQRLS